MRPAEGRAYEDERGNRAVRVFARAPRVAEQRALHARVAQVRAARGRARLHLRAVRRRQLVRNSREVRVALVMLLRQQEHPARRLEN